MVAMVSDLIEECKDLKEWVENAKKTAMEAAYAHRGTIYQKELKEDVRRLDYVPIIADRIRELRQESEDYDAKIKVDREGYISILLRFPIKKEEFQQAIEAKNKFLKENGKQYAMCVRMPEEIYKAAHNRVEQVFKGFEMNANGSYDMVSCYTLAREVRFVKCR